MGHRSGDAGGASLVEVTVAMAVASVLTLAVFGLLESTSRVTRATETRAETAERTAVLRERLGAALRAGVTLERASATEVCTTARPRTPVAADAATGFLTDPPEVDRREVCLRLEAGRLLADTTTSGAPSTESILTGVTEADVRYLDADEADLGTGEAPLDAQDLAAVRTVVFTATVTGDRGRTREDLELVFALGAARFSSEQSWRGRVASPPTETDP
jgi:type II secretory pathway pseudopilin PulG